VRAGAQSLSDWIEAEGYDADHQIMDQLGLLFDSDPRRISSSGTSQAGQPGGVYPGVEDKDNGAAGESGERERGIGARGHGEQIDRGPSAMPPIIAPWPGSSTSSMAQWRASMPGARERPSKLRL
jgi:hypothetical protein